MIPICSTIVLHDTADLYVQTVSTCMHAYVHTSEHNARVQNRLATLLVLVPNFNSFNRNVQKMRLTKVKFDWPLAKIGWKMANDQLLCCAVYIHT